MDHYGTALTLVASIPLAISLSLVLVKTYCRWKDGQVGFDDYLVCAAWVSLPAYPHPFSILLLILSPPLFSLLGTAWYANPD
jgi:hypothetical protein